MRFTIKSWPVLLSAALPLCAAALAGCTLSGHTASDNSLNVCHASVLPGWRCGPLC